MFALELNLQKHRPDEHVKLGPIVGKDCSQVTKLENDLPSNNSGIDVLIICALKDEYTQVVNVTEGILPGGWVESINSAGRIISEATLDRKSVV